jgi:hypothetical protein
MLKFADVIKTQTLDYVREELKKKVVFNLITQFKNNKKSCFIYLLETV